MICKMINYAVLILLSRLLSATTRINGQLHEKYVGCFEGNGQNPKSETVLQDANNLTIEICIQKCYNETNTEMTFASLNNGRRCICRNDYGQQLIDRKCNVKCSGDQLQFCGGTGIDQFYSLYTVCPVGYFGPECDQVCHCKRQMPCIRGTGECPEGCEKQWTGMACNRSNVNEQYIGCYKDASARAMTEWNPGNKFGSNGYPNNSVEFCIQTCLSINYAYAGVQYATHCFCGNKYDRYGALPERSCNMPCPGNKNQKCGGGYANSVYYTCPRGFSGRNCADRIHSVDGRPCINGSCTCKTGWTGVACNIRDCGINNGDCESDENCHTVDLGFANFSACRCKEGSYRDNNTCRPIYLDYVGCYKGSTTRFVALELPTNDTLTVEFCIQRCRQLNKTYSFLQGGDTCLCGDDHGQILPDSDCQVPCAGNKLQYCGGRNTVDGTPIYALYAVNHMLWCSSDADCKLNEGCIDVGLKYLNVSRCRCKQGFNRMTVWEYCTDIDECQSDTSLCDSNSAYCFNSVGSYRCECKDGFTLKFGKCVECNSTSTTTIILGAFLSISLLVIALFIFFRIYSAKSRTPEAGINVAQPDFNPNSMKTSDQRETHYNEIPAAQSSIREEIKMGRRQTRLNRTNAYAVLTKEEF